MAPPVRASSRTPLASTATRSPSAETLQSQRQALTGKPAIASGPAAVQSQQRVLAAQPELQRSQTLAQNRYDLNRAQRVAAGVELASRPGSQALAEGEAAAVCTLAFRNKLLDAVQFAHGMWRLQAHFQNVTVMAVTAIGTPGCLTGPQLAPQIRVAPQVAACTGLEEEIVDAVADGVSANFYAWQSHVTVPGLPWYPAFAAFPGPMAPPMPNVPTPLIACPSSQQAKLMVASELARALKDSLPAAARTPLTEGLMDNLAACLALGFTMWLPSQQVMLVMGKGPVPSYAPPYVPVGPVVSGDIIAVAGHLVNGSGLSIPRLPYNPA